MAQQFEILTTDEFQEKEAEAFRKIYAGVHERKPRFCKVICEKNACFGTLVVPEKKRPSSQKNTFGFYITKEKIIWSDDTGFVKKALQELQKYGKMEDLFFDFLQHIVAEDLIYLHQYEEHLTRYEEALLRKNVKDFEWKILETRKDLSALSAYYEQLEDVGEILRQEAMERGDEKRASLLESYCDRVNRLFTMVQELKEYSMQLREMHQTQIDIRQNEIMKVLTIVTTIFMPLTLITGWYGMNFSHMPELESAWGYGIVIIVCIVILLIEFWYFRKKKWLD